MLKSDGARFLKKKSIGPFWGSKGGPKHSRVIYRFGSFFNADFRFRLCFAKFSILGPRGKRVGVPQKPDLATFAENLTK